MSESKILENSIVKGGIGMNLSEGIREFVKKLDLPFAAASLAEDYAKRFAEAKYDKLAQTKIFRSLKSLEQREKMLVELAFYSFNILLKKKFNFSTPAGIFLGGLIADFFPEMGKRLMNGEDSPDPDEQEVIELVKYEGERDYYRPKEKTAEKYNSPSKASDGPLRNIVKPARERMIDYLKKQGG